MGDVINIHRRFGSNRSGDDNACVELAALCFQDIDDNVCKAMMLKVKVQEYISDILGAKSSAIMCKQLA
jgi:hypothetical protein